MRIDVTDEIEKARVWALNNPGHPEVLVGVAWGLEMVSGRDSNEILAEIHAHPARARSGPPLVGTAPPVPISGSPVYDEYGPGLGPITRIGQGPRVVQPDDPFQPPRAFAVDLEGSGQVVEIGESYGERAARAKAQRDAERPSETIELGAEDVGEVAALMAQAREPDATPDV